jgi:hypothetical protein
MDAPTTAGDNPWYNPLQPSWRRIPLTTRIELSRLVVGAEGWFADFLRLEADEVSSWTCIRTLITSSGNNNVVLTAPPKSPAAKGQSDSRQLNDLVPDMFDKPVWQPVDLLAPQMLWRPPHFIMPFFFSWEIPVRVCSACDSWPRWRRWSHVRSYRLLQTLVWSLNTDVTIRLRG